MSMNKLVRRAVSMVLVVAAVFLLCCPAYAQVPQSEEKSGFTQEDFLVTRGQKIVNAKGETIRLKGVNLGAWMVWEDWCLRTENGFQDTGHYDEHISEYI